MSERSRASAGPQGSRPAGGSGGYLPVRTELSERELEIIELVATGLTNQEIAVKLTISKRTVDNHVSNIFTKTGAKNRVALLNWAMDNGKICRDGFNCCSLDGPREG
jgi:DNA-binding NarL/FixJ family response regulator